MSNRHILKLTFIFNFLKYRKKINNVVLKNSYKLIKHKFFFKNVNKTQMFNINIINPYHYDLSTINRIKKSKKKKKLKLLYEKRLFRSLKGSTYLNEYGQTFYKSLYTKLFFQINNSLGVKRKHVFWKRNLGAYLKFCFFNFFSKKVKNTSKFYFILGCSHPIGNYFSKFFSKELLDDYNYSKINFNFNYDISQYLDIESNFYSYFSDVELFFLDLEKIKPVINSINYSIFLKVFSCKTVYLNNFFFKSYSYFNLKLLTTYIYSYDKDGIANFQYSKDKLIRFQNIVYRGTFDSVFLLDKKKIDINYFSFFFIFFYKKRVKRNKLYHIIKNILVS